MCGLKALILLALIHGINCEIRHPVLSEEIDLTFFFMVVWISCVFRLVSMRYNLPVPCELLMLVLGGAWGIFASHNKVAALASQICYVHPLEVMYIYYPVLCFWIMFCMDVSIFLKALPQILVIGIPVAALTSIMFGCIVRPIVAPEWPLYTGLLVGVFSSPVYPATVLNLLKRQTSRTKQIAVLLEGETVVTIILSKATHSLFFSYKTGSIVNLGHLIGSSCRLAICDSLTGLVFGSFARFLIRKIYTDKLSVAMLIFSLPFLFYAFTTKFISGGGSLCVVIAGAMMAQERAALSKNIDNFLTDYWETIAFALDLTVTATLGVIFTSTAASEKHLQHYIQGLIISVMYFVLRFISFLVFSPLLSRLGYGMDLRNMAVCVWGGIKCPLNLILVRHFMVLHDPVTVARAELAYFHITILYMLSLLVNVTFMPTILSFLGLREISVARQMNMNNCIKHILTKRDRTIAILKMDRFLSDTNWSKVIKATNVKHPYQLDLKVKDEDDFFVGYHHTYCPDCNKEIPRQPTNKEFKEMQKEAKRRILKAKKMSYSRQYENGMMSRTGIRILTQAVELAMDSEENIIQLEGLQKKFSEAGYFTRFVRNRVQELQKVKQSSLKPPRKYFRRFCYDVVTNKNWEKIMLIIVFHHAVLLVFDIYYHSSLSGVKTTTYRSHKALDVVIVALEGCFASLYSMEFVMKILAYSWLSIWKHGFWNYFRSGWNIMDFFVMLICFVNFFYALKHISSQSSPNLDNLKHQALNVLRLFRLFRFFRIFEIFYPKLMEYLDRNVDSRMALTYELGKSYAVGEAEILDMLPYMIDDKKIREEVRKKIEADRVLITKLLGVVQKEKPWIAITVKSKQAIRTILKSMNDAINELKNLGWIDNFEVEKLRDGMDYLYKNVNAIKTVEPSAPKVIFKEVAWMNDEKSVIDFLFENVTVKKFEPGDVVFGEGNVADGIYILVSGLFMITYTPDTNIINALNEYGCLPIVDYLSGTKYEEVNVDYIVSGNCIGELSTLTGRAYNCVITADAHSQVYVLKTGILKRAMELSPDPITGFVVFIVVTRDYEEILRLECRIWKEVSIRIAVPLLLSVPVYQAFSQDQIKYTLERAFVPDLSNYKIFVITEMIQDIILIEGIAADYNTRETFVAPSCIPRTVQKLILPTSSLMNVNVVNECKLLIIPEKDVDEYEVMLAAEENCELISAPSAAQWLQQSAHHQAKQRKSVNIQKSGHIRRKLRGAGNEDAKE